MLSACLQPWLSSMQCACTILYCRLWPVLLYRIFLHYTKNGTILGQIITVHKILVLIFYIIFFGTFLILRRNKQDIIMNVYWSSIKYQLFLSYFNKPKFIDSFSKNKRMSIFINIRPVGVESFHADGWTGRKTERHDESNSRFPILCPCIKT